MLEDIVVDTNILVHAGKPEVQYYREALAFVESLQAIQTVLCIDEGFQFDRAKNKSLIGDEYLEHLRSGSAGYAIITHLAGTGRIREVSRTVDGPTGRKICRLVKNKKDRRFLRVATNSEEKVFASHDFKDFPQWKRKIIRRELQVATILAAEARGRI